MKWLVVSTALYYRIIKINRKRSVYLMSQQMIWTLLITLNVFIGPLTHLKSIIIILECVVVLTIYKVNGLLRRIIVSTSCYTTAGSHVKLNMIKEVRCVSDLQCKLFQYAHMNLSKLLCFVSFRASNVKNKYIS